MAKDITIGQLANASGLSRSALLYYDRLGLLCPGNRSGGNYRLYSSNDIERLKTICLYRNLGIPLKEIAHLLQDTGTQTASAAILQRHVRILEKQIESLQQQQRQALKLLEQLNAETGNQRTPADKRALFVGHPSKRFESMKTDRKSKPQTRKENMDMVNKQRWTEIMRAAGLSEEDMKNWHRQFETLEPDAHQEFLETLGIDDDEIGRIRAWSRQK